MKAPTVTPTGCPRCGSGGMPGTACAVCTRHAHGVAVRAADDRWRASVTLHESAPPSFRVLGRVFGTTSEREAARAAWVGADLLLDVLGVLLVRVGFELPDVVEVRR